jgi:GT2 family glycosyltransferase
MGSILQREIAMTPKKISMIILNYNGEEMLPKCLPSIVSASKNSPVPCETIVLDNLSTDNSLELIAKNFRTVKIEKAKQNDFLFSYNDLILKLDSDTVILLNNDVAVDENFVKPLLKYFENDNVFAVFPKQLAFDKKTVVRGPHKAWMNMGVFNVGRKFERGEEPLKPSFTLYGFNGAFDRAKFVKLGGFDKLFGPFTWEDTDICYRAWKKGWASVWEPASVVYHDESHILDKEYKLNRRALPSRRVITRRNSILFLWKNIQDPGMLLGHILLQPLKLIKSLFNDRAYIAAFFEALKRFPQALKTRANETRKVRVLSDAEIFDLVDNDKIDLKKLNIKPKVGIITTWYKRGVSYQSLFLAGSLKDKCDVSILAYKEFERDLAKKDDHDITFIRNPSPKDIIRWIKEKKIQVVFSVDRLEDERVLHWCASNGVAAVDIINYETIKEKQFNKYRKLGALLCPVRSTYDLLSKYGFKNIYLVRWGIDPSVYSPAEREIKLPIRFIHNAGFGGASWRKNTEAVVSAFDKASKNNKGIQLVLKSQRPIAEYPEAVKKIVQANSRIIVNDNEVELKELLEIHRSCHVSILPSKFEGIGLPFLESLSMGLPVITVDAPPMNEWVKNDVNGVCCRVARLEERADKEFLVKSALVDVNDLASVIERFSDPKLVEDMRMNAIYGMKDSREKFSYGINAFLKALAEK